MRSTVRAYSHQGPGPRADQPGRIHISDFRQHHSLAKGSRSIHKGQGVTQNYAEAARWFRKAAEQGNADAQNHLGVLYDHGKGVTQDHAEAARWFRKAAEQG